jgi:hypothetical protein
VAPVAPGYGGGVVTLGPGNYPVGATAVMPPAAASHPVPGPVSAPEPTYPPAGLPPQYGTPMGPPPPYASAMLPFPGVAAPTVPAASRMSFAPTPSTMSTSSLSCWCVCALLWRQLCGLFPELGSEMSPHELPTPPYGSKGRPGLDLPMPPQAGQQFPQPPASASGSTGTHSVSHAC